MLEPLLTAFVLVPLAGALAIRASGDRWAEPWTYVAALLTFLIAVSLVSAEGVRAELLPILPGLSLTLMIDRLALAFALVASGLWIITSVYSSGYVRTAKVENRRRYFACF